MVSVSLFDCTSRCCVSAIGCRVLSKYIHEDDNIKLATGRAIGKRIAENITDDVGDVEEDDFDDDIVAAVKKWAVAVEKENSSNNVVQNAKFPPAPIIINYYSR
jgi:hypothetical protein